MHFSKQVVVAAVIFGPWLAALFLLQITLVTGMIGKTTPPWVLFWKRWDWLYLCPNFSFFSWLPTFHYHLLVRDLYTGSAWTPWRLVQLPKRRAARALWNPARRVRFALEDALKSLVSHLGRTCQDSGPVTLECFAYRYLCAFTASRGASPLTASRQFLIAQSKTGAPGQPPEILFISPVLSLGAYASPHDTALGQLTPAPTRSSHGA